MSYLKRKSIEFMKQWLLFKRVLKKNLKGVLIKLIGDLL